MKRQVLNLCIAVYRTDIDKYFFIVFNLPPHQKFHINEKKKNNIHRRHEELI